LNVPAKIDLKKYHLAVDETISFNVYGKVKQLVGLIIEGHCPGASVGCLCDIHPQSGGAPVLAEVVGFRDNTILLMPLGDIRGIVKGSRITLKNEKPVARVGEPLKGRIIDGLGMPIDGKGGLDLLEERSMYAPSINPMLRRRIKEVMSLGVRVLDGLLTCGRGQRLGIFAGSGVGKSVMLGMIAQNTAADVNVIALIGERGREVREFIERDLGEEGLKRSVVVVSSPDDPPLIRVRAAFLATTIAEYFRDEGNHVLLMMDSITRVAMAQREVGLAVGEPPTAKGYTPSVFTTLPRLLERVGTSDTDGDITGLYTVLVEGDDMNEPMADAMRSILDGHITLSRDLASKSHYPAVDVLNSVSRVMIDIVSNEQMDHVSRFREILATYGEAEDLINIGAYSEGVNPKIDYALSKIDRLLQFLRQDINENSSYQQTVRWLEDIFETPHDEGF
jgi:flagellum-specific ATP synthase